MINVLSPTTIMLMDLLAVNVHSLAKPVVDIQVIIVQPVNQVTHC